MMATVTRLPAKSLMKKTHKKKLLCGGVESKVCNLGDAMKRKKVDRNEDDEKDTNQSKLDSLPLDLKMATLARMSAKSLMKLRCVSKMWSSIIRSREFIDSYFSKSSTQTRFIVALSNGDSDGRLIFFFSFSDDEGEESSSLVPNLEMAMPSVIFSSMSGSCTSVHGILAVRASFELMICNPSTEQTIKLPCPIGFVGYDPIEDEHKVLSVRARNRNCNDHKEHKVLTLGGGQGWRTIQGTTAPYGPISAGICINGFVYYGAYSPTRPLNPGVVCFDVRSEKLSYIKAPEEVVVYGYEAIFIEYKGKLASIVRNPYDRFNSFALWILEDVAKHEWSKQICVVPPSVWDSFGVVRMCFPGTNKAGELIMAPQYLSRDVRPFYIFYYNVETNNIRRVRLLGIGDNEEFRRCYGFESDGECHVRIAPLHVESIAFFKDPPPII